VCKFEKGAWRHSKTDTSIVNATEYPLSRLSRFFPFIQDAEYHIYNLQKGIRRRAVCMSNGERAAEGILDLDEELETIVNTWDVESIPDGH
jgi:hypothetical protein